MKLLIITASTAFDKNIKEILKKSEVKTFSYKKVKGYRDVTEESVSNNWFATEMNENESTLFYAFIDKENVDQVFELVSQFNEKQETISRIHVAVINVEKSN
jgi:nitrogen regulatory protein PII